MSSDKPKQTPSFGYSLAVLTGVLAIVLGGYYFLNAGLEVMFLFSWLLVFPACMALGYSYGELEQGALEYIKKGMSAALLSLVVGGTISTWIAAGTVPSIIYYGLRYIKPNTFLAVAFLLSMVLSLSCGTAWGTLGTVGIAMFAVGESFGITPALTVGAIFSGAFLGETCTPMAATANVSAAVCGVPTMRHCKKAAELAIPSAGIASVLYFLLGQKFAAGSLPEASIAGLCSQLTDHFTICAAAFLPMLVMLLLIICKIPALFSMLISVLTACAVAVLVQGVELQSIASVFWNGASVEGGGEFLQALLSRGGVRSMVNTVCTMIFTFGMIGAFNTVGMMEALIAPVTQRASSPARLTAATQMVAVVGNMLGTNTFSILMAGSLMVNAYDRAGLERYSLSRDITATSTVLCPLIPWNVSGLYIAGLFGVSSLQAAPFAFCAFLTPALSYVFVSLEARQQKRTD